jgi:flagellar biosynthetic protein FliO
MLRKLSSSWLFGLTVLLASAPVWAEEKPAPGLSGDIGPTLLQLAGALLLIIVIIYLSVWLMKKYSGGKIAGGSGLISIVERRHLAPKQVLYLIKVGEKHLLIGASDSGLQKLSDIEDLEVKTAKPSPALGVSRFSQALKQAKESLMPRMIVKEKSAEA